MAGQLFLCAAIILAGMKLAIAFLAGVLFGSLVSVACLRQWARDNARAEFGRELGKAIEAATGPH